MAGPLRHIGKKILRHHLGLFGAIIIVIALVVSLLGNLITPDKTNNANQINLPIALLKPMSSILFFEVPSPESQSFFDAWWNGRKEPLRSVAIQSYRIVNDTAILHLYHPEGKVLEEKLALKSFNNFRVHTKTFVLGTDGFGRDLLSRVIMGTRVSLSVGLVAVFISLLIGTTLGLMAGYFRGMTDSVISWFINVIWSLPTMLLVVAISFAMGKGFWQIFIAIGLSTWVEVARVVRGQVFSIREKEYIQAARVLGFGPFRIMFRHILPNLKSSLIVLSISIFGSAILLESGLSFLGLGIAPPAPSWGMMIKENFGYIMFDSAYLAIVPGLAIMLLVMAFNFVGIALRDALDIHLQ